MTRRPRPVHAFAAIDFETANNFPDSACAVAVVRVEDGAIVRVETRLIRPPTRSFIHTRVHGIAWEHVVNEPDFAGVWPAFEPMLEDVAFIAAHNAGFDQGVLKACCARAGIAPPAAPFRCTVKMAKEKWRLERGNLAAVCQHLGIPLNHHEAKSDVLACARIVLRAHGIGG